MYFSNTYFFTLIILNLLIGYSKYTQETAISQNVKRVKIRCLPCTTYTKPRCRSRSNSDVNGKKCSLLLISICPKSSEDKKKFESSTNTQIIEGVDDENKFNTVDNDRGKYNDLLPSYIPKEYLPLYPYDPEVCQGCILVKVIRKNNEMSRLKKDMCPQKEKYYKLLIPHNQLLCKRKSINRYCYKYFSCITKDLDLSKPMMFCPNRVAYRLIRNSCLNLNYNSDLNNYDDFDKRNRDYELGLLRQPKFPEPQRFANGPSNAHEYYMCYPHKGKVLKVKMNCPERMYFDKNLGMCVG